MTGRMHVGNYNGALRGWIEAAKVARESFFFSADWHALTSDYKDPSGIPAAQREMFADWIAAGLDAEKNVFFIQSQVKQHAELFLLLGMIAPIGWLERVPTYKEQQEQLRDKDLNNYGFPGNAIPDLVGNAQPSHRNTTNWINPGAFQGLSSSGDGSSANCGQDLNCQPFKYRYGNEPQHYNNLREAANKNIDLGIGKEFGGEKIKAELRGDFLKSRASHRLNVDGRSERHQAFVRADVRGRFLASYVLLARCKCEDETSPPLLIISLANEATGNLPSVFVACGKQSDERTAE